MSSEKPEHLALLVESFQFIGETPNTDILEKCLKLCEAHKISEEDLVDLWAAFSVASFKSTELSFERLELFEKKELQKMKDEKKVEPQSPERRVMEEMQVEEVVTPKAVKKQTQHQQQSSQSFSQTYSSPAAQVDKYENRNDSGKVLLKFGTNTTFIQCTSPISIELYGDVENHLSVNTRYMLETMVRKRMGISDATTFIARCIAKKNRIQLPEKYVKEQFGGEYLYGRIAGDFIEGKLNSASVLLELPSGDFSMGDTIGMNLSEIKNYSIFPGQTVVVKGNMVKETVNVKQLFTSAEKSPGFAFKLDEPFQVIVASGPFTLKSNLTYEPLQDLLKYVLEKQPHVLILTGPFLDAENDEVANCNMTESFDSFFHSLVESIMAPLEELMTMVVFVSSNKDAHHHPIYPTMPYKLKHQYRNLICAPDPCLLDVMGIIFGVTTVDSLFHVGKNEFCWPGNFGDRMTQLSQHLIDQLSFYPLYPPEPSVPIDHELLEKHGTMETVPHVLILPSIYRHFAKNVSGCTVINPEHLVRGYAGGSFAHLNVNCKDSVEVSCQIIRI